MAWLAEEVRATRETLRYGFAVGKVRVLETRALDRSALERLLDAGSYREQRRILSETVYGRYLEGVEGIEHIEAALAEALADFHKLLEEAELPEPVVRFFRLRADYWNLKAALKAELLGVPVEELLVPGGSVPLDSFLGDARKLPEPLGPLATRVLGEAADANRTLVEVDAAVDAAMFDGLHLAAKDAKSVFLQQVAALLSDTANIKVLVRARSAGLQGPQVRAMLVPGGTVSDEHLLGLYAKSPMDMAAGLERLPSVAHVPTEGLSEPGAVDVVADNVLVRLLKRSSRGSTGPEPVIAYVLAREAEVQALRVLLIGKLSGLDNEALRHRLRQTYR